MAKQSDVPFYSCYHYRGLLVFLWFLLTSCWCFLDSLVTLAVTDIDQLMRIMVLTGTPSAQLLVKLGSEEVTYYVPNSVVQLKPMCSIVIEVSLRLSFEEGVFLPCAL